MHVSQLPHGTKLRVLSSAFEPDLQPNEVVELDHGDTLCPPDPKSLVFFVRHTDIFAHSRRRAVSMAFGGQFAPVEQHAVDPAGKVPPQVLPDPAAHAADEWKREAFEAACRPLIEYMQAHGPRRASVMVSSTGAAMLVSTMIVPPPPG